MSSQSTDSIVQAIDRKQLERAWLAYGFMHFCGSVRDAKIGVVTQDFPWPGAVYKRGDVVFYRENETSLCVERPSLSGWLGQSGFVATFGTMIGVPKHYVSPIDPKSVVKLNGDGSSTINTEASVMVSESQPQTEPLEMFSMRIGDLEVRTCNERLSSNGDHCRAEIVKWEKKACITIAAWERNKDGFALKFLGSRPFEYSDPVRFWMLAKVCEEHLKKHFKACGN